jgi:predicted nuclease of predicted toxin-antitoxin system
VKLLFDENLSFPLVQLLAADFPDSTRVTTVGLAGASDAAVWEYAAAHGYTIVTKDDDFRSLSLVRGAPPKVINLRVGNGSTKTIVALLSGAKSVCEDELAARREATLLVLTFDAGTSGER